MGSVEDLPGVNPTYYRHPEPVPVEVEDDGVWSHGLAYARAQIDPAGPWRGGDAKRTWILLDLSAPL